MESAADGTAAALTPRPGAPRKARAAHVAAIIEVVLAFMIVHVTYRALRHFSVIGRWDATTNFTPGAVMIAFTVLVLLLTRRDFRVYGLGTDGWQRNVSLGLVCSILLITVWAIGLAVTRIHMDASKPPDPHSPDQLIRLAGLAVIALPAFIAVICLLRARSPLRIPAVVSVPIVCVLLAAPPLVAAHFGKPGWWSQALWLFLGAGFGEEIFFRGYIQSRVDQAFGCPYGLWGFQFGIGLLVSALLFGVIHALNTVDYFQGRFDFGWSYGLQAACEGVLFGAIRARTGSVLPGAIAHGLLDGFSRIPGMLP